MSILIGSKYLPILPLFAEKEFEHGTPDLLLRREKVLTLLTKVVSWKYWFFSYSSITCSIVLFSF
jgi:hypothetical protein